MLDSISSAFMSEIEATTRDVDSDVLDSVAQHKQPLEQYAFLLYWFVGAAERRASKAPPAEKPKRGKTTKKPQKGKSDEWIWNDQVQSALTVISKTLRLKTHRIWATTAERDVFIK
jgi:condensin complex subunit 1